MNRKEQLAKKLSAKRKVKNARKAAAASTKYSKLLAEVGVLKKKIEHLENGD